MLLEFVMVKHYNLIIFIGLGNFNSMKKSCNSQYDIVLKYINITY